MLEHRRAGEIVTVHAFRRDELLALPLALDAAPENTCWLDEDADATAEAKRRRKAWLGPD
jgi:predicted metalloprotease with PDZ domain